MKRNTLPVADHPAAEVCAALDAALAETAVTTMLAQNFHWNVTGETFLSLHQLFQEIYEDHFAAQDDIAERIKALDGVADGNLARMIERAYVSGEIYTRPSIQVTIDAQGTLRMIYVSGEVKNPQGVEYRNGMTVFNAITACGGPTDFADMKDVRLIRSGPDGRVQTIPCNLKYLSRGTGNDPQIKPNDRIIVPN